MRRIANVVGQLPFSFTLPPISWQATPVSHLPSWRGAKRIGIDLETDDPTLSTLGPGVRRGGRIIGISFAIAGGPSHYLPIGHSEGNLDREHVLSYCRSNANDFDGEVVGANLSYDLDYLWEAGIFFPKAKRYLDVQIAEPLINELRPSFSLQSIAGYHNLDGKDEDAMRQAAQAYYCNAKKGMSQLPARFVGGYAIQDAELPLRIIEKQLALIEQQELGRVWDVECRVLPALVRMRRRGVRIDLAHLQQVEDWTAAQKTAEVAKIRELSGVWFRENELFDDWADEDDVSKSRVLEYVLKAGIPGIQIARTETGEPNIDKKFLKSLKSPLADAILKARFMSKIRTGFCKSVREHMVNGRIHPSFKQIVTPREDQSGDDEGAKYGRLSCVKPNLQQQISKDEEYDKKKKAGKLEDDDVHMGKYWRSVYLPDEDRRWASLDYSSQEPRLAVHFGELVGCEGASELGDAWRANPDLDLHQRTAEITGLPRGQSKIIFLGRCYGMGSAKFAKGLELPTQWVWSNRRKKEIEVAGPEAQAVIDRFDAMVPWAKQLAQFCEGRAAENGFVRTLLGRRCHFPQDDDGNFQWLHKALNRVIQGSAADQTKLAVALADEAGEPLQLQVHDEVDLSVVDEAHAERVADIMRTCVKLSVPSKVDVEIGNSWGDSM